MGVVAGKNPPPAASTVDGAIVPNGALLSSQKGCGHMDPRAVCLRLHRTLAGPALPAEKAVAMAGLRVGILADPLEQVPRPRVRLDSAANIREVRLRQEQATCHRRRPFSQVGQRRAVCTPSQEKGPARSHGHAIRSAEPSRGHNRQGKSLWKTLAHSLGFCKINADGVFRRHRVSVRLQRL